MKKYAMELAMACLLLVSFYFLSREAAVASREIRQEDKVILVDPGHGGRDPGMIGIDNLEEKGINLSIAKLVRDNLEKKGFRVVMTRTGDEGLYEEDSANKKALDMQRRFALI